MKNFIGLLDILQVLLKITKDFVSLVISPPVNTNYFVAPFTNLDLINFMLSGLFSSLLPVKLLKYHIYQKWLYLLLS